MGGDPTGGDRDNADQYRMNLAYEPDKARGARYTVNGKTRTPVLNEQGRQVGYMGDPVLPSLVTGAIEALTGEKPQVYTGDPRYNPNPVIDTSGSDGGGLASLLLIRLPSNALN